MFSNTQRACATTSSPPTSSRLSSTGTMPETKRKPPASTASVKCEIGSAWPATRSSRRMSCLPLRESRDRLLPDLGQRLPRRQRLRVDAQLDHGGPAGAERRVEGGREVLRALDDRAVRSERLG